MFKKHLNIFLLILLILIAYAPFLINGGFIGDFGDPVGQTIPNKFLLTEYIKNGTLPLWNPFSLLGMPFLADIQVGTFYIPDLIIFSTFPPVEAHNISVILHLVFAGLGFFLLFSKLGFSKKTSLISSILLITTGSFLTKLVFLNMLETFSYLPWLLLITTQKSKVIPKLGLITALMIFAGHPVASFYVIFTVAIFCIIYYLKESKKLLKIITGILLGILISAVQLIPFWELKSLSVRDQISSEEFVGGALPFRELLGFINPFKDNAAYLVDRYLHFGTIAFFALLISPFFYKKYSEKFKKIFCIGLFLSFIGLFLATLGGPEIIGKILYHIPIINLTRVASRFLFIFYFGASLCIGVFIEYLLGRNKKIAYTIGTIIIINSITITNLFLDRHETKDAYKQYEFENQNLLKTTPEPQYFLNSGSFLFPNRHYLSLTSNIIGYNPLVLKNYYNKIPIQSFGGFSEPNYFMNNYNNFIKYGLRYYIFPTESKKINVINFLKENGWKPIATEREKFTVWENPNPQPFAHFENPENKLIIENFSPGKISLKVNMKSPDKLILNQSYYPGWQAKINVDNRSQTIKANIYDELIQSYEIPKTTNIELIFKSKNIIYGMLISLLSLMGSLYYIFRKNKN